MQLTIGEPQEKIAFLSFLPSNMEFDYQSHICGGLVIMIHHLHSAIRQNTCCYGDSIVSISVHMCNGLIVR